MDTIKDLSTLTSVPYANLMQVCKKIEDIICHSVKESLTEDVSSVELNMGFGKLIVYVNEEEVHYHFVPSYSLEQKLISTITEDEDVLVTELEKALQEKIVNSYKDLF